MSGPLGSDQWMYSTGFYPYEIDQSLRFNDDDTAYLSRTPASAGNRRTWTWSGWVKRGNLGGVQHLFQCNGDGNYVGYVALSFINDALRLYNKNSISSDNYITTSAVYRDSSSWYHVVAVLDTSNATASERAKLYVNGEQITSFSTAIYPPLNFEYDLNLSGNPHAIGGDHQAYTYYLDGYMAEVNFIDGQALDPTDFGQFKSGVWIPKSYSGTYGTNGFYLDFGNSGSLGADSSGNGNNWTPTNLAATDQVPDSPTNNFCTLNPLRVGSNLAILDGNLKLAATVTGSKMVSSTFGVTTGKWYWESVIINPQQSLIGVENGLGSPTEYVGQSVNGWSYDMYTGGLYNSGLVSYGDTFTTNDVIGIAVDIDSGKLWFSKNGTWQNSGSPTDGTNAAATNLAGTIFPAFTPYNQYGACVANFGQDSSFAGNKTAQGNTDANGIGDFYYAPPAGYLALCTANLPDPVIDPAQDDVPADYFNTVLYQGDGSSPRSVTGVGFQPDLVWMKSRTDVLVHGLYDSVRGPAKLLISNLTVAEVANDPYGYISSYDADGFTLTAGTISNDTFNRGTDAYVSWNWKANGTGVSNTDGTITSTVSANQKAGFSIVSYTGNGTSNQTVGHGLNATPAMIIVKNRDVFTYTNWISWHKGLAANNNVQLDTTTAAYNFVTGSSYGGVGSSPTTSTFLLQNGTSTNQNVNDSGDRFIAYVFAEVEGFSKFGSYTGNGSSDGPFIYTGFRPAFVMIKRTDSTGSWWIHDTARNTYNVVDNYLFADASNAEASYDNLDMLSNGFKLRLATYQPNTASASFIYMAFAEMPFKYSNAR